MQLGALASSHESTHSWRTRQSFLIFLVCQFCFLRQVDEEDGSYRLWTEAELERDGCAFADEKEIKWEGESNGQMHHASFNL